MSNKTPKEVAALADMSEGRVFDLDIFKAIGVFVIREIFSVAQVEGWQQVWSEFQSNALDQRKVGLNKVEICEPLPEVLANLYDTPEHIKVAQQIFGEDVGLYNHRFVVKDRHASDEVFLHQDYCYHLGFPQKASFFTPLSRCGRENGGLEFFLGTHQYGYLGDAGEIDIERFPEWPTIIPELNPRDLVVMNSCLWHRSGKPSGGPDRIMADTILQPAHDPSTLKLICGKHGPVNQIDRSGDGSFFKRSRVTRLKELTAELNVLNARR